MEFQVTRRNFLKGAIVAGVSLAALPALSACGSSHSTKAEDNMKAYQSGNAEYYLFTDSCGREVALPKTISKIAPSGSYAQTILATLCPTKLACLSSNFSTSQLDYLDSCLKDLKVLGRFYGKNGDMNYEEIIKLNPDVILDIGEYKETIKEDMDGLQEQTGLPVVFVQATMDVIVDAYNTLGGICAEETRAGELANYIQGVLDYAKAHRSACAAESPRVVYSQGAYGYDVKPEGSIHATPLELVGINNVAKLDNINSTEVSPEQMMIWDPQVVLLSADDGFYDYIYDDSTWAPISAVQNKRVYEVPGRPYEWMDEPPSVQTVLGTLWVGNLLFPQIYNFDMIAKAQEFFKLFWNYELSETEARELLAHSTLL